MVLSLDFLQVVAKRAAEVLIGGDDFPIGLELDDGQGTAYSLESALGVPTKIRVKHKNDPLHFRNELRPEACPARSFLRSESDADGRDPAACRRDDKFEILDDGGTWRISADLAQRHHAVIDFEPKPRNRLSKRITGRQLRNHVK
ncbi:MAG: hypothetical protein ABSA66_03005 [Roseiarcus sp.]